MAAAEEARKPMLDYALTYLHAGLPVFPVCSPLMIGHQHRDPDTMKMVTCAGKSLGKTPLIRWRGYQHELPREDDVRTWWKHWPDANIGMATGTLSGILVLDADGTEARKSCLQNGGLDETPMIWTGKVGGAHFHLAYPGGDVRNFAGKLPGTDLRGQGGYVLMPPSLHASGNTYRWNESTRHHAYASVPDWLTELIESDAEADGEPLFGDDFDVSQVLTGIPEGKRDDTLYRYACRLRHDDVPKVEAEELLRLAARACKPAFDEAVAVGKVRRAYKEFEPAKSPSVTFDEEIRPPGTSSDPTIGTPLNDAPDDAPAVWKVYDIADFLDIEFPPVEWRIEGYLRERAILFSFGAPGSIKTFVATDAALSVASGSDFLGKFSCQQGRVLIVQEDTLASDFQQAYLRPMIQARGLTGDDLRGRLFIAPQAEFALDQTERLRDLSTWLDTHRPDLLILDAFYLMYSGRKEDLLNVMKIVKKIRNRYGCSIWIIDHNRKGQGDASGENPIDRLINGREKSAAVDVVMESRPVKGEQGSTFLDVLKLRGAKMPDAIRVTYADGRITVDGDDEVSPKGAAQTVYEWLCREGASRTIRHIIAGTDLGERTVRGAISELHRDGLARPFSGPGMAKTWYGVRRAEADPEPESGPTFTWDE